MSARPSLFVAAHALLSDLLRRRPLATSAVFVLSVLQTLSQGASIMLLMAMLGMLGLGGAGVGASAEILGILRAVLAAIGVPATIEVALGAFFLCFAAETVMKFVQRRLARKTIGEYVSALQGDLYASYVRANWLWWLKREPGGTAALLTGEGHRTLGAIDVLIRAIVDSLYVLMLIAVTLLLSWQLTLGFLAAAAILIALRSRRFDKARAAGEAVVSENRSLYDGVVENIGALKLVKSTGSERRSSAHVGALIAQQHRAEIRAAVARFRNEAVYAIANIAALCVGLYVAIVVLGMPAIEVMVLFAAFLRIVMLLTQITSNTEQFLNMEPGFRAISADLDKARAAAEAGGGTATPGLERALEFRGVVFRYAAEQRPVLDRIDLKIPAGALVAVIGASGAGKTTILDLAAGLVHPQEGVVAVDGQDLRDADLTSWRGRIGYLGQSPMLFDATIAENIRWCRPEASEADLHEAAKLAQAYEFISMRPEGFASRVGQRGMRISGGELQRIALARALIGRPRLLLLDEATSNLDRQSETAVQSAIDGLRGRLTVLMVAHRLETIRNADMICVLEAGRVAEIGTWSQLTRAGARFQKLAHAP